MKEIPRDLENLVTSENACYSVGFVLVTYGLRELYGGVNDYRKSLGIRKRIAASVIRAKTGSRFIAYGVGYIGAGGLIHISKNPILPSNDIAI